MDGIDYQAGGFYHYRRTITQDTAMTGLPVVFVKTTCAQKEIVKETWSEGGSVAILKPDTWELDYFGSTSVKGRGNTTWKECPKKPYAQKLDSKGVLLGMAKHKRWCLLANYLDRTLLRNAVAFEIAKCTSLDWTPSGHFVELVFNGVHQGNYFLCEQIKVDKNRVDITELEPDAFEGDAITGGYIIELDTYYDEVNHPKSTYLNKDLLGKIKAGPVWDFDWETFTPFNSLNSYEITGVYYSRLMQDPEFKSIVKSRWNEMKPQLLAIPDRIEQLSEEISASEAVNWSMWPITKDSDWKLRNINGDIWKSFPEAASRMKNAYSAKLQWMDKYIANL